MAFSSKHMVSVRCSPSSVDDTRMADEGNRAGELDGTSFLVVSNS
jgi:hypothetical protein